MVQRRAIGSPITPVSARDGRCGNEWGKCAGGKGRAGHYGLNGMRERAKLAGGELAVGEVAEFEVTVHVPFALGGQPLTNTASVTAEEGDPHPEDNSSTVTTEVQAAAEETAAQGASLAEQAGFPSMKKLILSLPVIALFQAVAASAAGVSRYAGSSRGTKQGRCHRGGSSS